MFFSTTSVVAVLAAFPLLSAGELVRGRLGPVDRRALATPSLPFNTASPGATPIFRPIAPPNLGPVTDIVALAGAASIRLGSPLDLAVRALSSAGTKSTKIVKRAVTCLDSTTNDTNINLLYYYGATVVNLCPGVIIPLYNNIYFTQPGQVLTTLGSPVDSTRATLQVANVNVTCAIYALGSNTAGVTIKNIQVDGGRPALGWVNGGYALFEIGGNGWNQVVSNVHAFEPRGWSTIHVMEGYQNNCQNSTITNSQIGPAGHAPSGAQQFRRRDSTGTYTPGQWADGISMACSGSTVTSNTITDATDGAIVIFGAPGTNVRGNTIIASDRQLLGGINMVDYFPFSGSFANVTVSSNTLIAQSSMIKVGIMIGTLSFQNYNSTAFRNDGGSILNNKLVSGSAGYFGFGLSVAGHNASTISGTTFQNANFGFVSTNVCDPNLPVAGPMVRNPWTTPFTVSNATFTTSAYDFLICTGPGAITSRNFTGTP